MGFNISGIVINKNLENDIAKLSKMLNLNLEFDTEIDFETASENWKEEGFVDVYYSERGTLVFANEDLCLGEGYAYPETNILTFALSETSMAFNFSYTENNNPIRSKMEVNGEVVDEYGSELKTENESNDISEVIWQQLSQLLGKSFWSIEPAEKAYRFLIKQSCNSIDIENESIELNDTKFDKFNFSNLLNREDLKTKYTKDELVELFNRMIRHAQQNSINIFLQPICYNDSMNIFMVNLVYLKNTISENDDLIKIFNSKIPMNAFGAIGRAYENQIDKETNIKMLQMITIMKPILLNEHNQDAPRSKKWWEFWK